MSKLEKILEEIHTSKNIDPDLISLLEILASGSDLSFHTIDYQKDCKMLRIVIKEGDKTHHQKMVNIENINDIPEEADKFKKEVAEGRFYKI